jgi:hypothetical protein
VGRLEKFWKHEVGNDTFLDDPLLKMGMDWWWGNARQAEEINRKNTGRTFSRKTPI